MVSMLIPYVQLIDHFDPNLDEFTYGDVEKRARKLKRDLQKGDFVFFHTSIRGNKFITAYYVVDRVLDTSEAVEDRLLVQKYKNPHLHEPERASGRYDDVIVFGDPILSKKLTRPLLFNRELAEKLSLNIPFSPNRSDKACIVSATRQWRRLAKNDVDILLKEIEKLEKEPISVDALLSTDEILQLREADLEDIIAKNPNYVENGLKLVARQYEITPTDRIDLLMEDGKGTLVVIELKIGVLGRKELSQLKRYMHEIKKKTDKPVRGILMGKDILPLFEGAMKKAKDVRVLFYGWKFGLTFAEL